MRIREMVAEIRSMAADPDDKRIIAHAQYWAHCAEAFEILRTNGYGQPGMSIVDVAKAVPEAPRVNRVSE